MRKLTGLRFIVNGIEAYRGDMDMVQRVIDLRESSDQPGGIDVRAGRTMFGLGTGCGVEFLWSEEREPEQSDACARPQGPWQELLD